MLFNSMLSHGYLPSPFYNSVLTSIVKDKLGSIHDKSNYRPIALSNTVAKLFEIVLLRRMENHVDSSPHQFGFKQKHSTDACVFLLKEMIRFYMKHGSPVFVCFMDASKAFDRVNHKTLFSKLIDKSIPFYLLRILSLWYRFQRICIKWNNVKTDFIGVNNGIRQGSILSPFLFNIYMDNLSLGLNELDVGCYFNNILVNHLFYADDIILLCPSHGGLQNLIDVCQRFGMVCDVLFNEKKTVCMVFKAKRYKQFYFHEFYLNEKPLKYVTNYKYLGHVVENTLNDDDDIYRQLRFIYARGNCLIQNFDRCSPQVKTLLFKTYMTNIYCCQLWCNFASKSFNDCKVAYNNVFRRFFNVPGHVDGITVSVSEAQSAQDIPTFSAVIERFKLSLYRRLIASENFIVTRILNTDMFANCRLVGDSSQL